MHPRYQGYIDDDYLKWIREQPSIVSMTPGPNDAHHVWNTGKPGKRNDYLAVPLTRGEHTQYHHYGHEWFEDKYNISFEAEIIKLLARYLHGSKTK